MQNIICMICHKFLENGKWVKKDIPQNARELQKLMLRFSKTLCPECNRLAYIPETKSKIKCLITGIIKLIKRRHLQQSDEGIFTVRIIPSYRYKVLQPLQPRKL